MTKTARERLEACLERIANPEGEGKRAFTKVYVEEARVAAAAADARAKYGHSLGPLDGRIVSIKDLLDVAGETTTGGSAVYRDAPPAKADAPVVTRLRAAGAVIVGKTNMTEFAFSGIGINPHYGTPGNPADRSRIPGGSSSGAAVALMDDMCEISIGTDTGGSIRVPAAFCGSVGFKPTQYRVPRDGAMALSMTLDSIGPLTRNVADALATDAILAGEAQRALMPRDVAGMRFAMPLGRLFEKLDAPVTRAFEMAVDMLLKAGARIVETDIEPLLNKLADINAIGSIAAIEAAYVHANVLRDRAGEVDRRVVTRIRGGSNVSGADYVRMIEMRRAAVEEAKRAFSVFDALILPSVAHVAPRIADMEANDALFVETNMLTLRNTTQFNMLDCCGYSLPIPGAGDLPVGLMLIGAHGADQQLHDVAAGVEALFATA